MLNNYAIITMRDIKNDFIADNSTCRIRIHV